MSSFICAIPLLSSLIAGCGVPPPLAVGYVEGDFVLIAPVETARIKALDVRRGDRVEAGMAVAEMERRDAEIAVAQARAALKQAQSQLADLRQGKRPEEIAVLTAALNSARAQAADAEINVKRQADLLARRIAAQSAYDDAKTARDVAEAAVAQAEANLAVARLPARADQIASAEASVDQATASLENAEWRLQERLLTSPSSGTITDVIRNAGELGGPQAPVLSMLPDGAMKLRVYLAEASLSQVQTGTQFNVRCDGCSDGMTATVTYVADEPEFTPPVIYSLENRQKLVYLVEAAPDDNAGVLKPGQIVDVVLAQ